MRNLILGIVALFRGDKVWQVFKLARLFDRQIKTLRKRGCSQSIIAYIQTKKKEVITKAKAIEVGDGRLPFAIVIPKSRNGTYSLKLSTLVGMLGKIKEHKQSLLEFDGVEDKIQVPELPYFIYGVGVELLTAGKSPEEARVIVEELDHRCLTVAELVAFATHTNILSYLKKISNGKIWNVSVFAVSSRYKKHEPCIAFPDRHVILVPDLIISESSYLLWRIIVDGYSYSLRATSHNDTGLATYSITASCCSRG
ncbi:MAG: hypothetical protein PHS07_02165 [Patescibacteria group bacterium]|nr:hypothetical protein [Patescibacteria group bacterium]